MMASSREGEPKQEGYNININDMDKFFYSSSSRQWSAFRNPRIVRVSRSSGGGGKDRHSKVCTVRGLRDRRIRLSVPTAVQLYDLQEKLGLSQPSKVIDWLLEASKLDIDKLPPLQFPPSQGILFNPQFLSHQHQTLFPPFGASLYDVDYSTASARLRGIKEVEKGKWIMKTSSEEEESNNNNSQDIRDGGYNCNQVSASTTTQRLFPMENLLNNHNNYHYPQFRSHGGLMFDPHGGSGGGSGGVQFPPLPPPPPLFGTTTPYALPLVENNDPRVLQFNNHHHHHQFLMNSTSLTSHQIHSPFIRPFPTPFSSKLLHTPDDNECRQDHKGTPRS